MPVVYNATLKTDRMQLVADLLSGKTIAASTGTATAGTLVIGDSTLNGTANGVLASITLSAPAGTVTGNAFTLSGTPLSAVATATGTAAKAELRNANGLPVVSGLTVGTSGADINLGSTAISTGLTISVNSGVINHN